MSLTLEVTGLIAQEVLQHLVLSSIYWGMEKEVTVICI
jgi:hypothetical protein